MEDDSLETKCKEKEIRLHQAENYLKMVVEKAELGVKEGERYWRERTVERLAGASIDPAGWDNWAWELYE